MSGAKRGDCYFWLCERSKQVIAVRLITRKEIERNMIKAAVTKEQSARQNSFPEQMSKILIIFWMAQKKEPIKKRIFRRFFPWKKSRK